MDLEIKGKNAFVSGSSSGIGEAVALELAAEGCNVVIHGRNRDRAEDVARRCEEKGVSAAVAIGDLSRESEAEEACDQALKSFGNIDILVNNAGRTLRYDNPAWDELTSDEYVESFDVNFLSGVRLARRFVPAMRASKWGRVVNVSSTVSTHVWGILVDYGVPKAAVNKLTADMSKTLGPDGITVNAIIPGTILTPAIQDYMDALRDGNGWSQDPAEVERKYIELNPQSVPRLGLPADTAALVTFLASPRAGYINGAMVRIDGGMAQFM